MQLNLIVANIAVAEVNEELQKVNPDYKVTFITDGFFQRIMFDNYCLWDSNDGSEFYTEWKLIDYLLSEIAVRLHIKK